MELIPGIKLKYSIISSNMESVTEEAMALEMERLGGLGIIHRFMDQEKQLKQLQNLKYKICCIGVGEKEFERLRYINENTKLDGVLIDIAHGYCDLMLEQIERIKNYCELKIIAGNTATYEGAYDLLKAGAHSIKASVGSGSICSTRIQTGNGVPLVTTLIDSRKAIEDFYSNEKPEFKPTLLADGGIRNAGDFVKILAAGADGAIMGSVFAGTFEAPGPIINGKKRYSGMASSAAQMNWKGYVQAVEGETVYVPYKGFAKDVFNNFLAGVLSGFSYQDARNIKELQENAVFIRQTEAGYRESIPHATLKYKG
jgi:IMP dehydrogenase